MTIMANSTVFSAVVRSVMPLLLRRLRVRWRGLAGHVHLFDHGRLRRSIMRQRVRRHPDQRGPYSKLAHERDEGTWS